ncbi:MAG: c-type cytochrome [Lewinellaceae bacterium]|nr:c-type cytochrome [Saprospiraceae bacterium]MCB9336690.1 c-type cytochrome [Lewinellaceae bacterium]
MKKLKFAALALLVVFLFLNLTWKKTFLAVEEMNVADVLVQLGEAPAPHQPDFGIEGVSAERGRDIVTKGRTSSPFGGESKRVSKHFVCTSCHNIERDEPDLSKTDPEARLAYVREKGLPYLQGSALYGVFDRSSFYNGDYEKKYGDLVNAARHDLRQAIHLCATQCAQGRPLEDWEMESVLAYFQTISLKMSDLRIPDTELQKIDKALKGNGDKSASAKMVKSHFMDGFPATFLDPPQDRRTGFSNTGDVEKGKEIYELSCLHCHDDKRYSFFNLDNSRLSFEFLNQHFPRYDRYSVYQVARYGTPPVPWKRAYMPHYTKEKLSEQMLEDLRAYVEQQAGQE